TATLVANELGFETRAEEEAPPPVVEEEIAPEVASTKQVLWEDTDPAKLRPRPPVVTVLGHVDHGKTSLLDAIRATNVTAREAGGITQHIGAYQIEHNGRKVTFLDTPGHEAFTAMRARGAQVTDVAVLVVAADDGVQPQTIEAISHIKAAQVPIVVALNKIDRPDANLDQVKAQLAENGVAGEEFGGDTPLVAVSAKTKEGIEDLVEVVLLVADVAELKADPDRPAIGRVIEAHLDKGRGPVATVLVQTGTLERGDLVVAGTTFGKVRAMVDDKGKNVGRAEPSRPVEILGLPEVPEAGDVIRAVPDGKAPARRVADSTNVDVRQYKVIYELLDDMQKALTGMLEPEMVESTLGHAEVRQIFTSGKTTIAGCMVVDGVIRRGAQARLLRGGTAVYDGKIATLRRIKDDVREVNAGLECGIVLENNNDVQVGHIVE